MTIPVRDIFNTPLADIWKLEDKLHSVLYEDGVTVENRRKELIFNRYCWSLFNLYPSTPVTTKCDVKTLIGNGFFNGETHIRLLEAIFGHICEQNNLRFYHQKSELLKQVQLTVNLIFNEIVHTAGTKVSTIDAVDFINLVNDPTIKDIHTNLKPIPDSVESSYREIKQYVNSGNADNRFVRAYRSKAINENQANQCIGPVGFRTDLDRTVFRQPIVNGFIRGMGNLYEIIAESLTAAKSLNANDTHIETSEYASRRIQLFTMSVTSVDVNDCGSTDYYDLFVTENMLDNLKGIYYLKSDNTLDYIRGNEKHLVNSIIKIRTAFGCRAPDPTQICTTCLGKVSENFKENSNLGYTMTSYLMEKLTQTILSTKHLTHSVKKSLIKLEGVANKYFYTNEENNIFFNKDLDLKGLFLILPNSRISKLVDVLNLPHTNVSLTKVGEMDLIGIRDMKHKTPLLESVNISYRDRLSVITKQLLEHIKNNPIESDARGNFVIPLDNFNKDFPVFYNPLKETNIISFVNKIASMIETTKDKVFDPYEKFITLFNAVTEQFKCNISVIQVIVYATTTYNAMNGNYRLGRNSPTARVDSRTNIFRSRSISQLLVLEDQIKEIQANPEIIFGNHYRMSHPMDALFDVSKVVN